MCVDINKKGNIKRMKMSELHDTQMASVAKAVALAQHNLSHLPSTPQHTFFCSAS